VEIILRRNAKCVGDAIEEGKHRGDVNRFGNLVFAPSGIAEPLDVGVRGLRGGKSNFFYVVEQGALGGRKTCVVELTLENCLYAFIGGPLNTQEVSVGVQSIRAAVEEGNVAGDHLFVAASQVAFGKMHRIRELKDLAEKIGTRAETFDDARDLRASGAFAPGIVGRGDVARGSGILGDANLRGGIIRVGSAGAGRVRCFFLFVSWHSEISRVEPGYRRESPPDPARPHNK
jgi:hypothetical protein